jgi:hypothetical protein
MFEGMSIEELEIVLNKADAAVIAGELKEVTDFLSQQNNHIITRFLDKNRLSITGTRTTPLFHAVVNGHFLIAKLLLSAGAKVEIGLLNWLKKNKGEHLHNIYMHFLVFLQSSSIPCGLSSMHNDIVQRAININNNIVFVEEEVDEETAELLLINRNLLATNVTKLIEGDDTLPIETITALKNQINNEYFDKVLYEVEDADGKAPPQFAYCAELLICDDLRTKINECINSRLKQHAFEKYLETLEAPTRAIADAVPNLPVDISRLIADFATIPSLTPVKGGINELTLTISERRTLYFAYCLYSTCSRASSETTPNVTQEQEAIDAYAHQLGSAHAVCLLKEHQEQSRSSRCCIM